jgi:putative transposase
MTYNPQKHHRQSIRLRNYDYTSSGVYFVTICTQDPQDTLSNIQENTTQPTEIGQIVQNTWNDLPNRYNIQTDEFIIMPDHIHGIIIINPPNPNTVTPPNTTQNVGALLAAPNATDERQGAASSTPTPKHASLAEIVRGFKSISAIAVNKSLGRSGVPFWQRNYYEHIVQDDLELQRVREYILWNPARWLEKRDVVGFLDARAEAKE